MYNDEKAQTYWDKLWDKEGMDRCLLCIYIRTWQYIFSVYVSTVVYRYVYVMLWFRYGGYKYRHFATEIILLPK